MAEPITDEELEQVEKILTTGTFRPEDALPLGIITRLLAEVRRLRSDEWLEKAAQEIAGLMNQAAVDVGHAWPEPTLDLLVCSAMTAILRKHRDSKGETG